MFKVQGKPFSPFRWWSIFPVMRGYTRLHNDPRDVQVIIPKHVTLHGKRSLLLWLRVLRGDKILHRLVRPKVIARVLVRGGGRTRGSSRCEDQSRGWKDVWKEPRKAQSPQNVTKSKQRILRLRASRSQPCWHRDSSPVGPLTPELWGNDRVLFQAPAFLVTCHSSNRKPIQRILGMWGFDYSHQKRWVTLF